MFQRSSGWKAVAVASVLTLAGCEDYVERRDTLTLGVGDSVAFNKATQTISRWPAAAREDRWLSDGERGRIAQSRYRTRTVPSPKTLEKDGGADLGADATGADAVQSGGK